MLSGSLEEYGVEAISVRFRHRSGREFPVLIVSQPLERDGERVGFIGLAHDTTHTDPESIKAAIRRQTWEDSK